MTTLHLLVIEDSELDYEMLLATLTLQDVRAITSRVETASGLRAALARQVWDLIISDHHLPGFSSGEAFEIVKTLNDPPPFIIVSGMIGEDAAVEAMRRGVDDYLIKGRLARLGMAVRNAMSACAVRRDKARMALQLENSQTQLRNLSAQLQTRIDEERTAISREIHDEVGGTLTAVRFDLELLDRHVAEPHAERLRRALATLGQATQAAQRIMRDLRPPILDAGLVAALDWQATQFRNRSGIGVIFTSNVSTIDTTPAVAMTVHRTCQEALTNITKHACANQVTVDLHYDGDVLSLEVIDNGLGFDAAELRKPASLGLRGLTERARAVHGDVEMSSARGRTTLLLWIPLGKQVPAEPQQVAA